MLPIDAQTLRDIAAGPSAKGSGNQKRITDAIGPFMAPLMDKYDINTPLRMAHFLGQCCEESDRFATLEEYASGENYEGRKDLGNTRAGDGRLFKGRGIVQVTGGFNYKHIGDMIGVDLYTHPVRACEPEIAVKTACAFWRAHSINAIADMDDIVDVTRCVNGGTNGLTFRKMFTANAKIAIARLQALQLGFTQPQEGHPVLHRGATGEQVAMLQRALKTIGFPIMVDGDFGPATELAVRQVQQTTTGVVDGIVGVMTWKAIQGELNSVNSGHDPA